MNLEIKLLGQPKETTTTGKQASKEHFLFILFELINISKVDFNR